MSLGLYMIFGVSIFIVILLGIVVVKMIMKKELPSNNYTPFDYIMAQSTIEFHEEKQVKEVDDDHGDDKDKNL
ncbi:hypothetical protein Back11_10660 [Paenibacillus baekrokdamisoli]|uniref:Uncharacterized protein n=1 Tax=Paenibacillus baekrokdamisoli TaxID=1712516 RepID=A0A3G9J1K2_9BACL|nr:DUF3951 domain-containing protein [Paenibacillus baekrokdamisoli]MBB3067087.1 uncharacterized protein YneF (UPF0154 family) [Paenibacillus baekrokdamisoli]BBH19721.1 hypothetical protein Back11_10660 [Paenibacillus baekrokdamisoli]